MGQVLIRHDGPWWTPRGGSSPLSLTASVHPKEAREKLSSRENAGQLFVTISPTEKKLQGMSFDSGFLILFRVDFVMCGKIYPSFAYFHVDFHL